VTARDATVDPIRSSSRGVICRADLLRYLAVRRVQDPKLEIDRVALERGADWYGYQRIAASIELDGLVDGGDVSQSGVPSSDGKQAGRRRPAPQVAQLRAVTERVARNKGSAGSDGQIARDARSLSPLLPADTQASSRKRLVQYENLIPRARLIPALRRVLSATRHGPIDAVRLATWLAERREFARVPRGKTKRWSPELVVVLDFGERMTPYAFDLHQLAESLLAQCGGGSISLRMIEHDRFDEWTDWVELTRDDDLGSKRAVGVTRRPWRMPPQGSRVMLVSDLGAFSGHASPSSRA